MSADSVAAVTATTVAAPCPWHEGQWQRLRAQREGGQLPHALLLSTQAQCGAAEFALALARLLLCAQPQDGLNCGHCHACELSAAGNHGDLRWIGPEKDSRDIKIEQVRSAIDFTQGTAVLGERKVAIFNPADRMNNNGFNALLKSLEEPSAGTYLILVCNAMHAVPATIRSRCQLLRLPAPGRAQGLAWLAEEFGAAAEHERALELAHGSPLLAASILREGSVDALAERRLALRALLAGDISVPEAWQAWAECEALEFLHELAAELRHLLRGLDSAALAGRAGRAAFALLDEVYTLQRAISAGSNPGRRALVDHLLAKCHRELGALCLGGSIQTVSGGIEA